MNIPRIPLRIKYASAIGFVVALFLASSAAVLAMQPANHSTTYKLNRTLRATLEKPVSSANSSVNTPTTSIPSGVVTPTATTAQTGTTKQVATGQTEVPKATNTSVTPPVTLPAQTSPNVNPVTQGFTISVDPSQISSTSTGFYFPFQITRTGGFTGPVTPNAVTVSPQGTWPNYIQVEEIFMLTPDTGAFILIPNMYHPQDVTITVTASGYPNQAAHVASYSFQFHFPFAYY